MSNSTGIIMDQWEYAYRDFTVQWRLYSESYVQLLALYIWFTVQWIICAFVHV